MSWKHPFQRALRWVYPFGPVTVPLRPVLRADKEELNSVRAEIESLKQARSRFFGAVHHDLRQPFQAMRLFLHLLQNRVSIPEQQELLSQLGKSLDSGEQLISSLLDLTTFEAKIVHAQNSFFFFDKVVRAVVDDLEPEARAKGLRLIAAPSSVQISGDPDLLCKMLRLLIKNAIQYTDRGKVLVGCRRRGSSALIQVWDTGRGIASDKIPHIFEEFYQIHNAQRDRTKGLGIGLAMATKMATLLKTTIHVTSVLGRGSVFFFTLPSVGGGGPTPVSVASRDSQSLARKTVGLIEDDPLQLMALRLMLEDWGCVPLTAAGAEEFMDLLSRTKSAPEVILSDFRLPGGITGLDLIDAVRTDYGPDIPAIILTGDADAEASQELHAQRVHVLSKPIQPQRLRRILEDVVGE